MVKVRDAGVKLTCRDCGRQFVFTEGEQEFYERMGFTPPIRCRECRSNKEKQNGHSTCSECGIKLPKSATVYCETCLKSRQTVYLSCSQCGTEQRGDTLLYCETCLTQVQIDSERKIEKYKKTARAAELKLQAAESQNEELQRSLYETKQQITELELKVKNLSQDLEKAYRFHVASGWLKPALENIAGRLKALEQVEQETKFSVATVVHQMQEMSQNGSLWKMIKHHIRPHRKRSPA